MKKERSMISDRRNSSEIPLVQGYLYKWKGGLFKEWQKRWFRVEGDKLMYYGDRNDLEHLGWIDLSECEINKDFHEMQEPFCFTIKTPGRNYILRAPKKEHLNAWIDCLSLWNDKFKIEKKVSFYSKQNNERLLEARKNSQMNLNLGSSGSAIPQYGSTSPRMSPRMSPRGTGSHSPRLSPRLDSRRMHHSVEEFHDNNASASGDSAEDVPVEAHYQALTQLNEILEKVIHQEDLLNNAMKKVEKFKQKAYVLQDLLEFQRDSVKDPARRINTIMKSYTSLERAIDLIAKSMEVGGTNGSSRRSQVGAQEQEVRMKLVVQNSEAKLAEEKRKNKALEEKLFKSEVMCMKLNEVMSGGNANNVDVAEMWEQCRREEISPNEYNLWIQKQFEKKRNKRK